MQTVPAPDFTAVKPVEQAMLLVGTGLLGLGLLEEPQVSRDRRPVMELVPPLAWPPLVESLPEMALPPRLTAPSATWLPLPMLSPPVGVSQQTRRSLPDDV